MSICPIAEQDPEGAISAEIANSSVPGRPLKYPASLEKKMYDKSRDIHKIAIFRIRRNFTVRKRRTDGSIMSLAKLFYILSLEECKSFFSTSLGCLLLLVFVPKNSLRTKLIKATGIQCISRKHYFHIRDLILFNPF